MPVISHNSWAYNQRLCILHKEVGLIRFNFPWIATLLLQEILQMMRNKVIPSNPIVNRFIFEEGFFEEMEMCQVLHWKILDFQHSRSNKVK